MVTLSPNSDSQEPAFDGEPFSRYGSHPVSGRPAASFQYDGTAYVVMAAYDAEGVDAPVEEARFLLISRAADDLPVAIATRVDDEDVQTYPRAAGLVQGRQSRYAVQSIQCSADVAHELVDRALHAARLR